jgi:large subunit ribosomal protein L4
MPVLPVYDFKKTKVGSIELSDVIFGVEPKLHLINAAVRAQIAWRFECKTANSRTRSEVSGTRRKMYKQKGTGRARHGDAKAPIFVGGGKAHGPKPRRVVHKINKKVMRSALLSALAIVQQRDGIVVLDNMFLEKPCTSEIARLTKLFGAKNGLFVNCSETPGENVFNRSVLNLYGFKVVRPDGLNVFDIMKYKNLFVSQKALQKIIERFTNAA